MATFQILDFGFVILDFQTASPIKSGKSGFCSLRVVLCGFAVPVLAFGCRSLRLKPRNHTKRHEQNIRQIPIFISIQNLKSQIQNRLDPT